MNAQSWALSDDLGTPSIALAIALSVLALGLLAFELRRSKGRALSVYLSGLLGVLLLLCAVLRPVTIATTSNAVGPRVVVLLDSSRRHLLPAGTKTRFERAFQAIDELPQHLSGARLSLQSFGEGRPEVFEGAAGISGLKLSQGSDLSRAIAELSTHAGERPRAVVVLSDGRLSSPLAESTSEALSDVVGRLGVPVHTVRLAEEAPRDASIRSVRAAGAAVAHQPLRLTIEVLCVDLACDRVPVRVRELRDGVEPASLGEALAKVDGDVGTVELDVTLDRAGARVLEVSIDAPDGDTVPQNNSRHLTFVVARDRVRLLHLAGRPTYDVRALRRWLKSDESVDLVAFFILRGDPDDPGARESELALIRFPVDELFTQHLPSFDAVILQDIDAIRYKLSQYLLRLSQYVKAGGGLIMVGGPSSFSGGNYAGTPLDEILPVEQRVGGDAADPATFVPEYTEAGQVAAMTQRLRELFGESLPPMAGTNLVGAARPGSIVLWQHPKLEAEQAPMPILALGESGDGRSIALTLDSTHRLAFGDMAASASGRAYGALWDGLLGWLMRDPRYEAARVELEGECIAGEPPRLKVTRLPGMSGPLEVRIQPLGVSSDQAVEKRVETDASGSTVLAIEPLAAGGYTAKVRVGAAPPTRHDFACEHGGEAFSDPRPDPKRLRRIAEATNGVSVAWDELDELPQLKGTEVAAERHVSPVAPPWMWTLGAALVLGVHWVTRRQSGLA